MPNTLASFFRLIARQGAATVLLALLGAALDACRRRRFGIIPSPAPYCDDITIWCRPTPNRFLQALRRRLDLPQEDFRRRATSDDTTSARPSVVPVRDTILLAGQRALADATVRAFLLRKFADGTLQIAGPDDAITTIRPGCQILLCGLEANAEGQARLLGLCHRGIACDWLTGAGETPRDEIPLREACRQQATPTPDGGRLDCTPIAVPPALTFAHGAIRLRQPLRILTYRWHVPHQSELFKLGAHFTLVGDLGEGSCGWWDLGQRPLPANARFARWREIDPRGFDLAILHFDENVLQAAADAHGIGNHWGATFRFLRRHLEIPHVAVCHGTPPAGNDTARAALVDFLGDTPVIVNSHQALAEWRFAKARVIWHGFDPAQFPCRPEPGLRATRILTLPGEAIAERPGYRGAGLLEEVAARVTAPLEPLRVAEPNLLLNGNAYAAAKFAHYLVALHGFDIYFNPTLRSPMPRSRGEAMLCGLATVNADSHDVGHFIDNGANGFYAATAAELADQIGFLLADPARAWRIGQAGRQTAIRAFHIDRYLDDWRRLIREVLGSDAI